jgi:bleomycin hydrolase
MKKYNLNKHFHISINHLLFWDKLEKCNYFLDFIIKNHDNNFYSEEVQHAICHPCSDGGYWHTFYNLVKKYGLVPASVFRRKYSSRNTTDVNQLLKYKLREFATRIFNINNTFPDKLTVDQMYELKKEYIEILTKILTQMFGAPFFPDTKFDWTYETKSREKISFADLTPMKFYKNHFDINFDNFVNLINDPRPRHPYNLLYKNNEATHSMSKNKQFNKPYLMVNMEMNEITKLVMKQIDDGVPVWFTCDVGQFVDHENNIMDMNIYNYDIPFNTSFKKMSKADRLDFRDSYGSHVMLIIGYDIESSKSENPRKKRKIDQSKEESDSESDDDSEYFDDYEEHTPSSFEVSNIKETKNDNDKKEQEKKIVKFKVENSWGDVGCQDGYYAMSYDWLEMFSYEFAIDKKYLSKEQRAILQTNPITFSFHDNL